MIALFATLAVSTAASNEDLMQEKEKAAWQAFKDKKPDDFKKVVSAKFMGVYAEGPSDMQKELADMQKWDMKSFAISNYKVAPIGSDTCVTTYNVTIEGTYDGKDQSGAYNAGSVWKKQNGQWQTIFHTTVKEEKSAAGQCPTLSFDRHLVSRHPLWPVDFAQSSLILNEIERAGEPQWLRGPIGRPLEPDVGNSAEGSEGPMPDWRFQPCDFSAHRFLL